MQRPVIDRRDESGQGGEWKKAAVQILRACETFSGISTKSSTSTNIIFSVYSTSERTFNAADMERGAKSL